jgi:predicted lipoprotein with Yx(FWY)xxD motif
MDVKCHTCENYDKDADRRSTICTGCSAFWPCLYKEDKDEKHEDNLAELLERCR